MEKAESRDRLILENAGLVRMMARRLGDGRSDPEDLIQWGQVGLIQAVDRFDPSYGVRFSTFAVPYIAGEIRRYLRENRSLKCSRELGRLCGSIRRFQQEFELKNGRAPSTTELCQSLMVSRENILLALCAAEPVRSLDEPLSSEDEDLCLSDVLAAESSSAEEHLDLRAGISSLPEQERDLIQLRYYQNKTQTETARHLGLSQVQVCRMEKRILKILRQKVI